MRGVAEEIKRLLSGFQVAEFYGFEPTRAGYISCPFHHEKTASLMVYKEPGRGWHCFGCGRGGSVIDFVIALYDIPFKQACIRLSADFGLDLTPRRRTTLDASKILAERQERADRIAREWAEYNELADEFRYCWEIVKFFPPIRRGDDVWYHPFYAEAIRRLPYIEYRLEQYMGR